MDISLIFAGICFTANSLLHQPSQFAIPSPPLKIKVIITGIRAYIHNKGDTSQISTYSQIIQYTCNCNKILELQLYSLISLALTPKQKSNNDNNQRDNKRAGVWEKITTNIFTVILKYLPPLWVWNENKKSFILNTYQIAHTHTHTNTCIALHTYKQC